MPSSPEKLFNTALQFGQHHAVIVDDILEMHLRMQIRSDNRKPFLRIAFKMNVVPFEAQYEVYIM